MYYSAHLKVSAAILGIAAAALGSTAVASPGSGVTPTNFVTADLVEDYQANHDGIKFQTKDPTTVRMQQLVFAPGGFTDVVARIGADRAHRLDDAEAVESRSVV